MEQLDGLVPSALFNEEETELHHGIGNEVVVELELLLTEQTKTFCCVLDSFKCSNPKVFLGAT